MIFFEKQDVNGDVVAKSLDYHVNEGSGEKIIQGNNGNLKLVIGDRDLLRSSRLFGKLSSLAYDIFESVYKYYQDAYTAQSHTLKKIQGQLRQQIEGIVEHPLLRTAENYEQQKQMIVDIFSKKPESIADTLIYLQKRVFELGAHMSSFEILYMKERLYIDKQKHNIRRLILNIWHGFDDAFEKKDIRYHFYFEDGIAEENKLYADYKTMNAALYNIFDNAVKYSMPGSEIRFNFNIDGDSFRLMINTLSLSIDEDELPNICSLGYRGRNCVGIEGSGVGLYIVKKALKLNGLDFDIKSTDSVVKEHEGKVYKTNTIEISGFFR